MQVQAEKWLSSGKGFLGVAQGTQDDTERMRFALASFMLIDQGQNSFFRYHDSTNVAYRSLWDYPEYHVDLGDPLGPRYQDGSSWRRDFACGRVMVDPVSKSYEFTPDDSLPTCNR